MSSARNNCLNLQGNCKRDTCRLTEDIIGYCQRRWKCCRSWWILLPVPTPAIYSDYVEPIKPKIKWNLEKHQKWNMFVSKNFRIYTLNTAGFIINFYHPLSIKINNYMLISNQPKYYFFETHFNPEKSSLKVRKIDIDIHTQQCGKVASGKLL